MKKSPRNFFLFIIFFSVFGLIFFYNQNKKLKKQATNQQIKQETQNEHPSKKSPKTISQRVRVPSSTLFHHVHKSFRSSIISVHIRLGQIYDFKGALVRSCRDRTHGRRKRHPASSILRYQTPGHGLPTMNSVLAPSLGRNF